MRTLVCVPAMDEVKTLFFLSWDKLRKPEGTELAVSSSSLVYDSRNKLAQRAVKGKYDRVLWLDSDMTFDPDLLERFNADIDKGMDIVCGLYFTRRMPIKPCVYKVCELREEGGIFYPTLKAFDTWGKEPFKVAACGFGAVMMKTEILNKVMQRDQPFTPLVGFGEDFSFCLRARELGAHIWCDPTISVGHVGTSVITEDTYWATRGTH